jgi:uncharacterized membrane protein YqjE
MSEETGNAESIARHSEREGQKLLLYHAAIWSFGFTVFVILIANRMWDTDEIRLHILHTIVQILQAFARIIGLWALEFEKAYNDYADTLH